MHAELAQEASGGGMSRADGLIDPFRIPGVAIAPDLIRSAAWSLAAAGAGISEHGTSAVSTWQTMPSVYEAPESDALLAVMAPVGTESTELSAGFSSVAAALTAFAHAAEPIVKTLQDLRAEAIAFVAEAAGGYDVPGVEQSKERTARGDLVDSSRGGRYTTPAHHVEWTEHPPYVKRNDALITAVAVQLTALDEAQADCVNAIAAAHPSTTSCAPPAEGTDFVAAAKAHDAMPFGHTAAPPQNCVTSFAGGMGDAGKGMVEGLGSLVSYNPETGKWGDWGHAGASALGVVEGLGALIAPTPIFQALADDSSGVTPGWMRDFSKSTVDKQQRMVDGFVGSKEQWEKDPARAAGSLFVNVGSLFIPGAGEVAAGAKVAAVGARMIEVGGKAAEAADVATVAGRLTKVGGDALLESGLHVTRAGLGLEALSDRVAALSDIPRNATAGAVGSLQEVLARVPRLAVTVERMATPDSTWMLPGLHLHLEHPQPGRAGVAENIASSAGKPGTGLVEAGRETVGHARRAAESAGPSSGIRATDAVAGTAEHQGAATARTAHSHSPSPSGTLVEERGASTGHGAEHDHGTGTGGEHHDPAHAPHGTAADSPASTHDAAHEHPRPADAADFDGPPADPANRRPIPSWITDRLASTDLPAWKKRILQGHEFNYANHHRYPHNEIETSRRTRLDSYRPGRWIVSRKHTQVADIKWQTMKRYIDEIDKKYAPGTKIKKTQLPLVGERVLEIPPQVKPIPQPILDYASRHNVSVILRDSNGRAYNIIEGTHA